jgi:Spy/CpxP family protein refolding chaperone
MKSRTGVIFALLVVAIVLLAAVVVGQQPPDSPMQPNPPMQPRMPNGPQPPQRPNPPNPPDPLADVMFPPDMIMGHARQLGLTDEQKTFMRGEIQRTMSTFTELQWRLQDEMELLHETMKTNSVNEQQALTQLKKVLDIEGEIKRLHFGLGIRLKNHLTPEQQEQLQKMRRGVPGE